MKKFITVLLTFTLYFNLISNANAASNVGGWSMGNPVAQGASAVYTGTKNVIINGADYIKKGTAKITPPASSVAKVLARGAAGYALSIAVEQLLGSVDWVLDPANNRIKYIEQTDPNLPSCAYIYISYSKNHCTFEEAIQTHYEKSTSRLEETTISTEVKNNGNTTCATYTYYSAPKTSNSQLLTATQCINRTLNPAYDPTAQSEEKYLPLPIVAQRVISNAQGGDTNAQVATMAAAADIVDEASKDESKAPPIVGQLEASAKTTPADAAAADSAGTGTGTQTKDPANPDVTNLTLEFPIFCNWAPSVCEAAQVVISFPQTLTDWWNTGKAKAEEWSTAISETWTKVKEWVLTEPETEPEQPELPEPEQPEIDTDIAFDGQCPADREASVNMGVGVIKLPISYEPICTTVSTAKPILIFVGFFVAALIIGGVKTE